MNNQKQSWLLLLFTLLFFSISFSGVAHGKKWVNIGPTPILSAGGGSFGHGAVTGRVADVAIDPDDLNHWLIGAAFGGVWETHNGGMTWAPRTDDQPSLAMGSIAFSQSDPKVVYAGTGEAVWFVGAGLLKSKDGGTTWQLLTDQFADTSFSDIKVDPNNPDSLIVATTWGKASHRMGGLISQTNTGVFKSLDGGESWSQLGDGRATDLEVDPHDFNRLYVGFGNEFGHPVNGVYRSQDGGDTWDLINIPMTQNQIGSGVGRIEIALAPSDPNIVYVIIQDAINSNGNDQYLLGLWRTENAWESEPMWVEIPLPNNNSPFSFGRQTHFDLEIIVDPEDADVLFAGGVELYRWTRGASPTWVNIRRSTIHVDQHTMAWAGKKLIVGNDGGVYSTTDNGDTWANHNTNLSITQFYYGSIHPTDPKFAIGGSQDNGTEIRTKTDAWKRIWSGDGADNAISSSNPNLHWALSTQGLGIVRTLDGGGKIRGASRGITGENLKLIAPFEKCSENDDVFIAGGEKTIWKTDSFFGFSDPVWYDNNSPIIDPIPGLGPGITGLAFAASEKNCLTYVFGTTTGLIYRTIDGGTNWAKIFPRQEGLCCISKLEFDPNDPNILYAVFFTKILKTTNALASSPVWQDVSPQGATTGLNSLLVDPLNPKDVYVGTHRGVWYSKDGGETWTFMGYETGMPAVPVYDLEANMLGDIVAFTHGRGAFKHSAGEIVVTDDEWTLSDQGFSQTPDDAAQFALNVASYFTGGSPGDFLVYSTPFALNTGLVGDQLKNTMESTGNTWTIISTMTDFSVDDLLEYDGIFLAGIGEHNGVSAVTPPDKQVLIDYVNAGGNVYIAGGTNPDKHQEEADQWNPFLNECGLNFETEQNDVYGIVQIDSNHSLFNDVEILYQINGNSISKLDPSDTRAAILANSYNEGLYAICSFVELEPWNLNDKFPDYGPNDVSTTPFKIIPPCTTKDESPAGGLIIEATFTNTSMETLSDLYFVVDTLETINGEKNVLCNADFVRGGEGSTITVERNSPLKPTESFTVEFKIGLKSRDRFKFYVDLMGRVQ